MIIEISNEDSEEEKEEKITKFIRNSLIFGTSILLIDKEDKEDEED